MSNARTTRFAAQAICLGIAVVFLAGCNNEMKLATNSKLSGGLWSIRVTSPAFKNEETFPAKYTAQGMNVSPAISWSPGPDQTKEYALIVEDPDARGDMPAVHWIVYHIPANRRSLPEDASRTDKSLVQGQNYKGQIGYTGPDLKPGSSHRYYFEVFALENPLSAPPGADRKTLRESLQGFVLAKGQLVGVYAPQDKPLPK